MRTEQRWKEIILPKLIHEYTPRISKILLNMNDILNINTTINVGESVYIYGPTNYGKTIYAIRLLLRYELQLYLQKKNSNNNISKFISVLSLFNKLRATYENKENINTLLLQYKICPLLILDDIGVKGASDWELGILYELINYRYECLLPTIYTSNVDINKLGDILNDSRIVSRIERSSKIIKKKKYK